MSSVLDHVSFAELVERATSRRGVSVGPEGARMRGADAREAESEICRRFAPRIRLYGLKHLRTEDAALDLVQRVLVAVIEAVRAGRVEEPKHLDRFVLGTCRHIAHRERAVEQRTEPTESDELEAHALARGGLAMPALEQLDVEAMLNCLATLELRAQTVLHLSFYRERSADEIAAVLDTSAGNVRVVRHRAMAQLRDCMEAA